MLIFALEKFFLVVGDAAFAGTLFSLIKILPDEAENSSISGTFDKKEKDDLAPHPPDYTFDVRKHLRYANDKADGGVASVGERKDDNKKFFCVIFVSSDDAAFQSFDFSSFGTFAKIARFYPIVDLNFEEVKNRQKTDKNK